ncbi:MAG TPA: sigma 54-interacting transcriptional regulator [Candidatus Acidoferrales bacterium]|jgi:formate hydrogenlyase transcriptional activator|nr:sigma 54-interacting transcriptional regulator [Candidatus Acidoferrales bacterium]
MTPTPQLAAAPPEPSDATRYEALFRVSQAISAYRDPKELFHTLASELSNLVRFDGIGVVQYDAAGNRTKWHLAEKCGSQDATSSREIAPEDAMTWWVHQNQQPVVISSVLEEIRFPPTMDRLKECGIQSGCVLPLATVHRRLGCLVIVSEQLSAYSEEEVCFLSLVAKQVALAMDDVLNFEASQLAQMQLEREKERLKLLLDLNNSIASNLNLRDLLGAVSANVRRVMQCDAVGVGLLDSETKQVRMFALDFPGGKGGEKEEGELKGEDSLFHKVLHSGEALILDRTELAELEGPDSAALAEGFRVICALPLISRNRTLGVLGLGRLHEGTFAQSDVDFLRQLANQVGIAVDNAMAYGQIADLKDKLAQEKVYLEDEIRTERHFEEIVGKSTALRRLLKEVETVAPTDSTVLIYGETGTGKELIARAIHNLSQRQPRSFVKLNCAAIPTGLLESELFGHERGAFTGAIAQRIGRFELAHQGTVFLDEIGEIPLELQPKLLRVLQEREFERLGSSRTLRTDARLIAATNRDLDAMVKEQRFREDLFYRLNVFPLRVPPLRERPEDIPLLVRHFADQFARRAKKTIETVSSETMKALCRYTWPGNIRELQNVIERAVIVSAGSVLRVPVGDLRSRTQPANKEVAQKETERQNIRSVLEEAERRHLMDVLQATNWVVAGPNGAAIRLGMKRSTLQFRMQKLGISRATV